MSKTVLVAGASGRFGSQCASEFERAGWSVRRYDRKSGSMVEAAKGADVIVNGLNPPNYQNWETEIPKITAQVIAAAKANNATVLIPGNVYVFGDQPAPWNELTPHTPNSRKGRIRKEMEATYKASGVPVINLRAGDFMDDGATGTWADLVLYSKLSKGKFVYPGDPNIPHAWGYLPDLARAAVALAERRESLEPYCDVCFHGFAVSGHTYMEAAEKALGRKLVMSKMGWWMLKMAAPVWRLGRELLEMRYLWDHPHALQSARFNELLPEFQTTDFETAVAKGLPTEIKPDEPMV